jgi:hypothetical protein
VTIEIYLPNKNMVALIDDVDAQLAKHRWCAQKADNMFYAKRNVPQERGPFRYRIKALHRIVMGVDDPNIKIDHINGNGLDCRRENLRIVSVSENTRNVERSRKTNQYSDFLGVSKNKGKWRARINVNGKLIEVNGLCSEQEAISERARLEILHYGISPRRASQVISAA